MDPQEFGDLIESLKNEETTIAANATLQDFLSDDQSIFFLFEMIELSTNVDIKLNSVTFVGIYMKNNFDSLDHEIQEQILDRLIELTFSEEPKYSDILHKTLCEYIKGNIEKCVSLLSIVENCFAQNQNIVLAMKVLSKIIMGFDDNLITENSEKFFDYSLEGLQSSNWELIIPSILVFLNTKNANKTETVEPHFELIIKHGQENNFYKQNKYFETYWSIIGDSIYNKIIPDDILGEIYNYVIEFASNEEIFYTYRIIPLQSLIGAVKLLDSDQLSTVLDLVFNISMAYVEKENNIPIEYFELISKSLMDLPMKDVYTMLKERISHMLSQDDRSSHVVSITIYSIVFDIAPDAAFSDIDSIVENLLSALEKEDELLNLAVCFVLESFHETFNSINVYAIKFLPPIVPLIISENDDLRLHANNALHDICRLITVSVQGFFEALWQIKDQVPDDELANYLDHLATAVEKSDDFDDSDTETLKEFILPYLTNLEDPNQASIFLHLMITLVTSNEDLMDELLPPAINVLMSCFTEENIGDSSKIDCFDFICNFYETFGDKYHESFTEPIQLTMKILFSNEENEEEEDEDEGNSSTIQTYALEACCTVAQQTNDAQLAVKLQEKCCDYFTYDYKKELAKDDDDDDVDDNMILTNEYDSIKQGSTSSCKIAKLLNSEEVDPEEAKTLFVNIYDYLEKTQFPQCAAEAMKPFTRLVHCAKDEEKEFYLNRTHQMLGKIIDGSLNAFGEKDIFNDQIDLFLMTNIAYLISEFVRYESPFVEELCEFMIQIIKSSLDSVYLYSFIGAYSDVIKYKTGSPEAIQEILDLVPLLLENAQDPDTKQNLAYLLILVVQNDHDAVQSIQPFVEVLQNWYTQGKESPNGHQIMLSNIASAFLTFMANGMDIDVTLLNEAVSEFPPFDEKETSSMIENMEKVFSSAQIEESTVEIAAFSLSKFFLLKDTEMKKRKVPQELMDTAYQMFITFSKSNPQIVQSILEKYSNTRSKFDKLNEILQE